MDVEYFSRFLRDLASTILALLLWAPLAGYGHTGVYLLGLQLNWIAILIGCGVIQFSHDFFDEGQNEKIYHYLIATIVAPVWLLVRYFIFKWLYPERS